MSKSSERTRIDDLIERFFCAFTNRNGNTPDLADLEDLFTEKAVIVQSLESGTLFSSVREFAQPRIELLNSGRLLEFHEWENDSVTNLYGPFATRVSYYEKAGILEGADYAGGGRKVFNLVNSGSNWRITSLFWQDDPGGSQSKEQYEKTKV